MDKNGGRARAKSPCATIVASLQFSRVKMTELAVTRIGNARGVRLPAEVVRRYQIGDTVLLEQRSDEIVLRPKQRRQEKISWEKTYKEMAQTDEDWSDWECPPEGLDALPGEAGK